MQSGSNLQVCNPNLQIRQDGAKRVLRSNLQSQCPDWHLGADSVIRLFGRFAGSTPTTYFVYMWVCAGQIVRGRSRTPNWGYRVTEGKNADASREWEEVTSQRHVHTHRRHRTARNVLSRHVKKLTQLGTGGSPGHGEAAVRQALTSPEAVRGRCCAAVA